MDRKAIAEETLAIMRQGYYELPEKEEKGNPHAGKRRIQIRADMEQSVRQSILITPKEGEALLHACEETGQGENHGKRADSAVENISTVDAIRKLSSQGKEKIGVLNFASAKNPGGGFLNGAMAQEESLAASGTLYRTLTAHEEYYQENRKFRSMVYTDYGIYSPDVIFFRDGGFNLAEPVKASVLTIPAVNMGQVIQKKEDIKEARRIMRRRMKLALAVFARQGARNLILGAYGCGVFRNDPKDVAAWWNELLWEEGMGERFDLIFYAVFDRSKNQSCIQAFQEQGKAGA